MTDAAAPRRFDAPTLVVPGADTLHALLLWGPDGPWVADLRSGTGTRLNDGAVRRQRLNPGDRVAFGGVGFEVRAPRPSPGSPSPGSPPPGHAGPPPVGQLRPARADGADGSRSLHDAIRAAIHDAVRDGVREELVRHEGRLDTLLTDLRQEILGELREELSAFQTLDEEVRALREHLSGRGPSAPARESGAGPPTGDAPTGNPPTLPPGREPPAAPARPSQPAARRQVGEAARDHAVLAERLARLERERAGRFAALMARIR